MATTRQLRTTVNNNVRRFPPLRVWVAWCKACGRVAAVAVHSDKHELPRHCPHCPAANWTSEDHPPRLSVRTYEVEPFKRVAMRKVKP